MDLLGHRRHRVVFEVEVDEKGLVWPFVELLETNDVAVALDDWIVSEDEIAVVPTHIDFDPVRALLESRADGGADVSSVGQDERAPAVGAGDTDRGGRGEIISRQVDR